MQSFGKLVTSQILKVDLQKQLLDVLDSQCKIDRKKLPLKKLPCVPFPRALTRELLDKIDWKNMKWSPKIDGTRALLMCCNRGLFLVDRHFDFYMLPFKVYLQKEWARVTLLDVELKAFKNEFKAAFGLDIISYLGVPLLHKPRKDRYALLPDIILQISGMLQIVSAELSLMFKEFYPIGSVREMRGTWKITDQLYVETDGVICISDNEPYLSSSLDTLVKIKPHNTVDVFADVDDIQFSHGIGHIRVWYLDKDNKEIIPFTSKGRVFVSSDVISELSSMAQSEVVCECGYDSKSQTWSAIKPRPDKPKANYYAVVKETLQLAENPVTCEMVKSRLKSSDDFKKTIV